MNNDRRLQLYTLGRFVINYGGRPLQNMLSQRGKALLVYLIFNRHDHPREVLADIVMDEFSAAGSFRRELSNLRKFAGQCLEITRWTTGLNGETTCWVDAIVLETGIKEIGQQPVDKISETTASQLEYCLNLYKGDFLAGLNGTSANFELWATMQSQKITNLVIIGMDHIVDYHTYHRHNEPGIIWAARLRNLDPLRSESYRKSMLLLSRIGQRSAALKLYRECAARLWREGGVRPTEETTALYNKLRDG